VKAVEDARASFGLPDSTPQKPGFCAEAGFLSLFCPPALCNGWGTSPGRTTGSRPATSSPACPAAGAACAPASSMICRAGWWGW